ncbi:DUF6882 domain-containing protein [Streptomyces virginiae]|uniref:DUF6882 domain-containing protein n=1 Tax=Streptomyces virginiae TaxID=1961 RepID=UPI00381D1B54
MSSATRSCWKPNGTRPGAPPNWRRSPRRGSEVVALTGGIERYGRAHAIAEFTEEVVDLSGFEDPRRAAETLAFAGMGVAEAPGYLGLPAGPDSQVYFLPDDPQVPRAGPTRCRCRANSSSAPP